MVERPSPEHGHGRRRITPNEEEIQTAAKEWAEQIVNRYIMKGEKFEFADPYPDQRGESKRRWEKRMMEIVREEAQKIIDDPSQPQEVKKRVRKIFRTWIRK